MRLFNGTGQTVRQASHQNALKNLANNILVLSIIGPTFANELVNLYANFGQKEFTASELATAVYQASGELDLLNPEQLLTSREPWPNKGALREALKNKLATFYTMGAKTGEATNIDRINTYAMLAPLYTAEELADAAFKNLPKILKTLQQSQPDRTSTTPSTKVTGNDATSSEITATSGGAGGGAGATAPSAPPEALKYEPSAPPESQKSDTTVDGKARKVYLKLPLNGGSTVCIAITPNSADAFGDIQQQKNFIQGLVNEFKAAFGHCTNQYDLEQTINKQDNMTSLGFKPTKNHTPGDNYRCLELFIAELMKQKAKLSLAEPTLAHYSPAKNPADIDSDSDDDRSLSPRS